MDTASDLNDGTSSRVRWLGAALLLALVLLAVLRSSTGTRLDSFTIDEPWHIVAGTSYARGDGFHLNPEHPPLVKLWVGAAMPADFRLRPQNTLAEKTQEREWVEQTMFLDNRSEEHTTELQSLMRISYAVVCLKKKIQITTH